MDESLSTQGHKVQRTFQDAQIALEQSASKMTDQLEPAALRSEMQRFLLWAANLGLFHQDHSSLDYRLRDNEVIRAFTKDQLSNLVESLDESQSLYCNCHQILIKYSHTRFDRRRGFAIQRGPSTRPQGPI